MTSFVFYYNENEGIKSFVKGKPHEILKRVEKLAE